MSSGAFNECGKGGMNGDQRAGTSTGEYRKTKVEKIGWVGTLLMQYERSEQTSE